MILLIFSIACSPSDNADWQDAGGWARVRSPPGHEDYACFVWAERGNPWVDALGGPECFPERTVDKGPS